MATLDDYLSIQAQVHPDYDITREEIKKVRDCMDGALMVKRETYTYLPHPSQVDTKSQEQQARYLQYLAQAEFREYPAKTKRSVLGRMRINDSNIELPERLAYLEQNADGDGVSMRSAIEYAVSNVMQVKWHLLVADYNGLSEAELTEVSLADVQAANPRATIKQYTRENVVNWHFDRVNGVMQLAWVMLLERGYEFEPETYTHAPLESYLVLALDENGDYYQQKIVYAPSGFQEGERSYVTVNGSPLKWLPVEIIADEEMPPMRFPVQLGFLYPICNATLSRYIVSADHNETQRNLAPTTYTEGWKSGDMEIFKEANGGRSYVATGAGAVNNMPLDVKVEIKSASAEMDSYHWYFEDNQKYIESLGGVTNRVQNTTATEADINATEQNALLQTIADNAETCFKRIVSYCAMFEGLWLPDDVENRLKDIVIDLPRDFATPRLTVDEVRVLIELRLQGEISREELHRQLESGGWTSVAVEQIMQEMENEAPMIGGNVNSPVDDNQ